MGFKLFLPATAFLNPSTYNALLTSHGITMLFLFGTPILAAFSNYFIPILIGADDVYEMTGVEGPDFAGNLADGQRYRFVDVQSRGELQSYVV